jgi:protein SCO1
MVKSFKTSPGGRASRSAGTSRASLMLVLALLALNLALPAAAVHAQQTDHASEEQILNQVSFDQNLNAAMPVDVPMIDEQGRSVTLGQFIGKKPAIMVFTYYDCPNLCPLILHGLSESLRTMQIEVGKEFDVVVASIDPRETPDQSTAAKAAIVASYGRWGTQDSWHFLTAPEDSIKRLADAAGFHYVYDAKSDEYAHPAGILVLTPDGHISKYLYGLEFSPRDLRLALVDASAGKIGTAVDQILLRCFHYDPTRGKYSVAIKEILKYAAVITTLGLGAMVLVLARAKPRNPGPPIITDDQEEGQQ